MASDLTICSTAENICSTNGRIYCQPKFDSDSHTCKCVRGEHCTRKEVISNNARLWLDVFQHTTPIMKIRANFTFTSDVPDTVERNPFVLYDSHRELYILKLRIPEETFQLKISFMESPNTFTGDVLIPQMEPNTKYELEISTYFDASSDTMVYSARVDGNEVVRIEHNDQIFGNGVRFSFGECPFCSITGIEYNVDQNPSEFMANQQTLQKFKNVYKNWIFSIDVMKTTDILTHSNAFKICDENTEQKIITLSGSGSTSLKIKQPGNFLLDIVKNVYYKILITQLYSPLLGKYIVEIRVDGLLLHKQVLQNDPLERTNFYAYAGFPGHDLTQGIKYRNYLFYTF
ncbi:uncharacterized protein [Clytia hemisphaerica]|uniref:uncharacterized protein isoform X2 n=1 Tax=Clytia hemisphaerica TaxID=252671 RepID=UPI0034D3C1C9